MRVFDVGEQYMYVCMYVFAHGENEGENEDKKK
jgi:hypothetical protein